MNRKKVVKKALISVVSVVLCFSLTVGGLLYYRSFETYSTVPHREDFELVWADEFDGTELDDEKWDGHYFLEGETYLRKGGYWNMDFATVKNGNLHISTEYFPKGYKGNDKPGWYTCAIDTQGKFTQTYGYFEIRCIIPYVKGAWSAFWLMPDDVAIIDGTGTDGAEIDVFESAYCSWNGFLNKQRVSSNIHYDGYGDEHRSVCVCEPCIIFNNPYENYNTYGVEWNEDEYIFYINGIKTGKTSFGGTSQVPEWPIISVEIGGENGVAGDSWVGEKIDENAKVPDFIIDYVRVYQYKNK